MERKTPIEIDLAGCPPHVAATGEPLLSPAQFTQACAEAIWKSQAALEVETPQDLQLAVPNDRGDLYIVYLDVHYELYKQEPESKGEVIARIVAATQTKLEFQFDPSRIVPIVKRKDWLQQSTPATGSPPLVYDELTPDLIVVYGVDSEHAIGYPNEGMLETAGVDRRSLRALATENLKKILLEFQVLEGEGLYMVAAGGDYESSFIFDDWSRFRDRIHGDFVFAIPARDLFYMTGSGDVEGLEKLRARAKTAFESASNPLTPELLTYRQGRLVVLGR